MIPRRVRLTGGIAAALALLSLVSNASADQLEDARLCTSEPQRLERLACFDEVLAPPWRHPGRNSRRRMPGDPSDGDRPTPALMQKMPVPVCFTGIPGEQLATW